MARVTIQKLLHTSAFRRSDMDALLDPHADSYVRFDSEMGYVPNGVVLQDVSRKRCSCRSRSDVVGAFLVKTAIGTSVFRIDS